MVKRRGTAGIEINYECKVGKEYAGKYVVILDGKIFASGARPETLLKRARKEHPDKIPFVYRVPAGESMLL